MEQSQTVFFTYLLLVFFVIKFLLGKTIESANRVNADEAKQVAENKQDEQEVVKEKKPSKNPFINDATDALVALGMKKTQARKMVIAAIGGDVEMPLDEIVKKALASKKV